MPTTVGELRLGVDHSHPAHEPVVATVDSPVPGPQEEITQDKFNKGKFD